MNSAVRAIGSLLTLWMLLTVGLPAGASADDSVIVEQNGLVFPAPVYPYLGHKYQFDNAPGDNDMPWLRQYSQTQGIFDNVNMSQDWKDREFEMMKAIIHYTTYRLTWTGSNTVPTSDRAKEILDLHHAHPSYTWGCGKISAVAVGLAQAHGIPARFVNAVSSTPPNTAFDYCCEFFSTKYNRWVWFCPKTYTWIEHEELGPLGMREIVAHDLVSPILANPISGIWTAVPNPPLIFMPSLVSRAPIPPHYSTKWWRTYWQNFRVTYKTQPNGTYPTCCATPKLQSVSNSLNYNLYRGQEFPIVDPTDLNINYPLNNVEAEAELDGGQVRITLRHNMTEFTGYQIRTQVDGEEPGAWQSMNLPQQGGGGPLANPQTVLWSSDESGRLYIRGTNVAGVHSPDVVIRLVRDTSVPTDSDGDGIPDDIDVCPNGPPGLAVDSQGRPRSDLNNDCLVNALDAQLFVSDLLNATEP